MKQEYDFSKGTCGKFFRDGAKLQLPVFAKKPNWSGPSGGIGAFIGREASKSLDAYRAQPKLVGEHLRSEKDTAYGGYAHRQLFELVQNSADALLESQYGCSILIRLTDRFLYCADDGTPIDEHGIEGLMFDRMSHKRNTNAIGRFGRGFKSVLRISESPEFYSRSGSFRFDKRRAAQRISEVVTADEYPVLRLPEPIDPTEAMNADEELFELMSWASNVVRLPLIAGAHKDLAEQIQNFPPEFMLFVDHVRYLTLEIGDSSRRFMLQRNGNELELETDNGKSCWQRFSIEHPLSPEARADWHLHYTEKYADIQWAVPLGGLGEPGHFWAFFPTDTASLVSGILNAPWKTNEDRQNLLSGPYNKELIQAAADMIAENIPKLSDSGDPARHLDALPRRHESGDSELTDYLRNRILCGLSGREVVPDQDGTLRSIEDISYPPKKLTDSSDTNALEQWSKCQNKPRDWLHHKALTRNRLPAIDRLFSSHAPGVNKVPRADISEWLEALVIGQEEDAIQASKSAILTAASLPRNSVESKNQLGRIVLSAKGVWRSPNPDCIFLPHDFAVGENSFDLTSCVHPNLASDHQVRTALKKIGLESPSPETIFKLAAKRIFQPHGGQAPDDTDHQNFWVASRRLSSKSAYEKIKDLINNSGMQKQLNSHLRVRIKPGHWKPIHSALLPGEIVPGDDTRDNEVTVDIKFHEQDEELLCEFGMTDVPCGCCELSVEPLFKRFLDRCRHQFISRDLPNKPHLYRLEFENSVGSGPAHVLAMLSEKGRAAYTQALLSLEATYSRWTMHHETRRRIYPDLRCESYPIYILKEFGRIKTANGKIVPLKDALGRPPKNPEALHTLLAHPLADRIKSTFDIAEPTPEFFGDEDPIPLTDLWPGLEAYLPEHRKQCLIVACERIRVAGKWLECVVVAHNVYIAGTVDDDRRRMLQLVVNGLDLKLAPRLVEDIFLGKTSAEVGERRAVVRKLATDPERLLEAIGKQSLRQGLPSSLLAVLEQDGVSLEGVDLAEAAISTYDTDALWQYRGALGHLGPPSQWAGSEPAIRFVESLGFSADWAGERRRRPEPFLEVEGRYKLTDLHCYQKVVVDNLRKMLRGDNLENTLRRGMVSMPTGSGKTRVAVQGIVEAIRDDGFVGSVLWVADRSELCEQAVEAWRKVWSSIGPHEQQLRISRMWEGQRTPLPKIELHVVVATIQTLQNRLSNQNGGYDFLKDFRLVVFDEAHRSIAPTFTSVMDEIGLTRRQETAEPFLVGLTATPYRGHNEEETRWLANRYGGNRLDVGAFDSDDPQDVVRELQSKDVLARADHETIEGESFSLDDFFHHSNLQQEMEEWRKRPWLPQKVEDHIAQSAVRTRRIIEAYEQYIDPDWPTLIFATSVEHAQTVAALLNRKGIPSRAVSAETKSTIRRNVVREFRRGSIKALVNYGVFREGFDAPKTRSIIVARPVYSPNLYFQMIGRGLRGAKNGGTERCLILNVHDNIEQFDRSLAYSELDWLWDKSRFSHAYSTKI